jgi:hypothetical protein
MCLWRSTRPDGVCERALALTAAVLLVGALRPIRDPRNWSPRSAREVRHFDASPKGLPPSTACAPDATCARGSEKVRLPPTKTAERAIASISKAPKNASHHNGNQGRGICDRRMLWAIRPSSRFVRGGLGVALDGAPSQRASCAGSSASQGLDPRHRPCLAEVSRSRPPASAAGANVFNAPG